MTRAARRGASRAEATRGMERRGGARGAARQPVSQSAAARRHDMGGHEARRPAGGATARPCGAPGHRRRRCLHRGLSSAWLGELAPPEPVLGNPAFEPGTRPHAGALQELPGNWFRETRSGTGGCCWEWDPGDASRTWFSGTHLGIRGTEDSNWNRGGSRFVWPPLQSRRANSTRLCGGCRTDLGNQNRNCFLGACFGSEGTQNLNRNRGPQLRPTGDSCTAMIAERLLGFAC